MRCLAVSSSRRIHIQKHSVSGFVYAEGLALFVDMGYHLFGHFLGSFGKIPFAALYFFHLVEEIFGNDLAARYGKAAAAKNGINTGCHKIVADRNCFFTHPFRGCACRRQIGNIIAKSAFLDDSGSCHQDAAVVDAGPMCSTGGIPTVSHISVSPEPHTSIAASGVSRPSLPPDGDAARCQNDNVVFNKLLYQGKVGSSCTVSALLHPTTPAMPRILPSIILSLSGLYEALNEPPSR